MKGLSATQIRKLTPGNGYTDKQLVNDVPHADGTIIKGAHWWANASISFFEDPPNAPKSTHDPDTVSKIVTRALCRSNIRACPVEVREDATCKAKCVIRFSDGNGTSVWLDPKYLLAAINTRRVGKSKGAQSNVEFYINNDPGMPTLYVKKNCHPIALLVGRVPPERDPDWSFRYTGELS